ncbi:MAG: hypothetical protein IPJ30_02150 [Acidobacteria bacterium]|nr:hypothetical protein [Acidobacteriota bacterium]
MIQTPGSQNQTSIQPASRSTVGYDIIEANYRSNLLDDVIRDSRIFLQSEPNHPKVNAIYGQSLFTQGKVAEAIPYLENAVVLGQAVTFRAFRGKILLNSESLDNVFIEVSDKAFAFQSKDESFVAEFSKLSEVAFVSNQSGMAYISVRGEFLYTEAKNKKQKTEKNKQIFLVAPMAGITKAAGGANILTGGATTINRIACSNCEVWTKEVVRFLNRCRTGEVKLNAVETVTSMRSGPLNNSKTVERPSAEFYPYVSERAFQMAIPRNWKAMPNGDMIFATDGARDGTAITHGAMVIFSNALYDRLPDAVRAVSQDILSGNTYLRLTGSTNAKLSGRDATVVSLEGRSPTTGKVEVAYLYIALLKDKRAVTFVFVCPDEERSVYQDTFNRMVASIRFKD